jgi:heat shock protein HslJ
MKTPLAVVFGLLVAVALPGCSSAGPPDGSGPTAPESLVGSSWKAESVAGRSTVAGREPTLTFELTRVGGSGGCNQFGGDYTYSDGRLAFGEMPMTLIGCEDPIGSIEADFLRVLGAGVSVTLHDGGRLLLEGPGGQALLVPATR